MTDRTNEVDSDYSEEEDQISSWIIKGHQMTLPEEYNFHSWVQYYSTPV
jgi:hypothetical protein